jgi:hypothetical protein
MVSQNVPTTFVTLFNNNMRLALQQKESLLWPLVDEKGGPGNELRELDDIFAAVKSMKGSNDGRHGDTQYANTGHDRLYIAKPDFDYYAELVDKNDQVQAAIQLDSGYMKTGTATINRARDDAFIAGFFGMMLSGKSGTIQVPFPSGNVVAVDLGAPAGVATGLNLAKVKASAKMLGQAFNDPTEEAYMVVTADDKMSLLDEIMVTNADYGASGIELKEGSLRRLFGFTFVEMETGNPLLWNTSLVDAGGGNRKTPFWKKSGMVRSTWWDLYTSIDMLPQKHFSKQVYCSFCGGTTRTDSGKVGYVLNKTA